MKRVVLVATAIVLGAVLTLPVATEAGAAVSKSQLACVNGLNAALRKVVKVQGAQASRCVKEFAKGKALPNPTLDECTTADNGGKAAAATNKTHAVFGAKCSDLPSVGADNPYVVNEAGMKKGLDLVHGLFGADLDAVIRTESAGRAESVCQRTVLAAALKCADVRLKTFGKCKKTALGGDPSPASATQLQEACMGHNGTAEGIPDVRQTISKTCQALIGQKAFTRKCAGVETSSLLVPQDAAAVDAAVACHVCLALNEAEHLDRDCDEFDDGLSNASCLAADQGAEVVCATQAPLAGGICEVQSGNAKTLITGTILASGQIYRGGQVLVDEGGSIACVGCDCSSLSAGATVVRCPQGVVSPGLINAHEHITYAQNNPHVDTGERYEHRHNWRTGSGGHTKILASGGATVAQIRWGELRHLMGGTTSMVGAGTAAGLVRNLDRDPGQEGLGQPPVDTETFPLGDSGGQMLTSGCAYPSITTAESIASTDGFLGHVAEGINAAARNEFLCLSSFADGGQDLVQPQSAFIHAVGLTAPDYAELATDDTELIWSPRSNLALYGDTAGVTAAARSGTTIALGTDWIVSGSMNLLRELRCADSFSTTYLDGFFTDEELWQMVTSNAAVATAMDDVLGSLQTGKVADVAVFDGSSHVDYRALIDANAPDVALVMRGGKTLYGDAAVVSALRGDTACDELDVCGTAKRVCLSDETGQDLPSLEAAVAGLYPAFFCGVPAGEPTCTPMRAASVDGSTAYSGDSTLTDPDGDGIEAGDNCPTVFNPVRPLDGGVQADADEDGIGDACDECPNSVACP